MACFQAHCKQYYVIGKSKYDAEHTAVQETKVVGLRDIMLDLFISRRLRTDSRSVTSAFLAFRSIYMFQRTSCREKTNPIQH